MRVYKIAQTAIITETLNFEIGEIAMTPLGVL